MLCWNWIRMTMYVTKLVVIPVSNEWLTVKYPFALKPWNFSNCNEMEAVGLFDDWDLRILVLMFDTSVTNSSLSLQKNINCKIIPIELPMFPINSGHSEKASTTNWNHIHKHNCETSITFLPLPDWAGKKIIVRDTKTQSINPIWSCVIIQKTGELIVVATLFNPLRKCLHSSMMSSIDSYCSMHLAHMISIMQRSPYITRK